MINPFSMNALNTRMNYQMPSIDSSSIGAGGKSGSGSVFANPQIQSPMGQPGGSGVSKVAGGNKLQEELNYIGSLKNPTDFGNGLGGTNNPDEHKLFLFA